MKWALLGLAACGRLHFDSLGDATSSGDSASGLGPFGPPQPVAALDTGGADNVTLTADMLEIYFDSGRPGGSGVADIWFATRASVDVDWNPPVNLAAVNTGSVDEFPEISADGLTLYYSSTRPGGAGQTDIWVTKRAMRGGTWAAPTRVTELATLGFDNSPTMTSDSLTMYLSSDRAVAGDREIYVTTRASTGAMWDPPIQVSELASPGDDGGAFLAADGRTLVFDSFRSGNLDLWQAERPGTSGPFGAPFPLTELDTPDRDSDAWLSPDQRTIYFISGRSGTEIIYEAHR